MNLTIISLADAYETEGDEQEVSPSSLLSSAVRAGIDNFKCAKSEYHVNFLKGKARHDHEHNTSRTYLVLNEDVAGCVMLEAPYDPDRLIVAYFTIGLSSIIIDAHDLASKRKKDIDKYNYSRDGSIGCYAIGEVCRSDAYSGEEISGSAILEMCANMLSEAQGIVGGRLVMVDSRECVFKKLYEPFGFKRLYVETPEWMGDVPLVTSYLKL